MTKDDIFDNFYSEALNYYNKLPKDLTQRQTALLLNEFRKTRNNDIKQKLLSGTTKYLVSYIIKNSEKICSLEQGSFEDALQDGNLVLLSVIEKSNVATENYKISVHRNLNNYFRSKTNYYSDYNFVNLDGFAKFEDDEKLYYNETVQIKNNIDFDLEEKIDIDNVLKYILPRFSDRHQEFFKRNIYNYQSYQEIGDQFGITSCTVKNVLTTIFRHFNYNSKINLKQRILKDKNKAHKICFVLSEKNKKLFELCGGRDFIVKNIYPKLTRRKEANFASKYILNDIGYKLPQYDGEETYAKVCKRILAICRFENPRILSSDAVKVFKEREDLIENYGGRQFLLKYFTLTLNKKENKVFCEMYLNNFGQSK